MNAITKSLSRRAAVKLVTAGGVAPRARAAGAARKTCR